MKKAITSIIVFMSLLVIFNPIVASAQQTETIEGIIFIDPLNKNFTQRINIVNISDSKYSNFNLSIKPFIENNTETNGRVIAPLLFPYIVDVNTTSKNISLGHFVRFDSSQIMNGISKMWLRLPLTNLTNNAAFNIRIYKSWISRSSFNVNFTDSGPIFNQPGAIKLIYNYSDNFSATGQIWYNNTINQTVNTLNSNYGLQWLKINAPILPGERYFIYYNFTNLTGNNHILFSPCDVLSDQEYNAWIKYNATEYYLDADLDLSIIAITGLGSGIGGVKNSETLAGNDLYIYIYNRTIDKVLTSTNNTFLNYLLPIYSSIGNNVLHRAFLMANNTEIAKTNLISETVNGTNFLIGSQNLSTSLPAYVSHIMLKIIMGMDDSKTISFYTENREDFTGTESYFYTYFRDPLAIFNISADGYINTTAEFNAGLHNNTATISNITNMPEDTVFMDIDGVNDTEISQSSKNNEIRFGNTTGTETWRAQSFNTSEDYILTQIDVNFSYIIGTPADVYIEIYNHTGSEPGIGYAETEKKAPGTILFNTSTSFNFTKPIKINSSERYYFVIKTDTYSTFGHYYSVWHENTSVYSNGSMWWQINPFESGAWFQLVTFDSEFIIMRQDFNTGANWTSANLTISNGKRLKQTYINYTVSANQNISKIEWYQGGSLKANYTTPITTGTEKTIGDGDVTGTLTNITEGNFTIKFYFESNGTYTPILNNVTVISEKSGKNTLNDKYYLALYSYIEAENSFWDNVRVNISLIFAEEPETEKQLTEIYSEYLAELGADEDPNIGQIILYAFGVSIMATLGPATAISFLILTKVIPKLLDAVRDALSNIWEKIAGFGVYLWGAISFTIDALMYIGYLALKSFYGMLSVLIYYFGIFSLLGILSSFEAYFFFDSKPAKQLKKRDLKREAYTAAVDIAWNKSYRIMSLIIGMFLLAFAIFNALRSLIPVV